MIRRVAAHGDVEAFTWPVSADPDELRASAAALLSWAAEHDGHGEYVPPRMSGTVHEQPPRVEVHGSASKPVSVHPGMTVIVSRSIVQRDQRVTYVGGGTVRETFIGTAFYAVSDLSEVRSSDLDWTFDSSALSRDDLIEEVVGVLRNVRDGIDTAIPENKCKPAVINNCIMRVRALGGSRG